MKYLLLAAVTILTYSLFGNLTKDNTISIHGPHKVSFQASQQDGKEQYEIFFVNSDSVLLNSQIITSESAINLMGKKIKSGDTVYLEAEVNYSGEIKKVKTIKEV